MILPGCQDTGTAICMGWYDFYSVFFWKFINEKFFFLIYIGKKGQHVWTDGNDEMHISKGVYNTYTNRNLRYSQVAPLDMFTEKKLIYIFFWI